MDPVPGMDPAVVAAIDARLAELQATHRVLIPLAIESGSRAWGFPSPDSDYDCRFVFIRRRDDYLTLFPKRDVIELPLEGVFDVNGWDLAKALRLLLKGNAVILEWLTSPLVYHADETFRAAFLELAREVVRPALIRRHYLRLGMRQERLIESETVPLKKLFYCLRPAAALRWMRFHPGAAFPPMHFPTLLEECAPPEEVRAAVAELLRKKAVTRELGSGPVPVPLAAFAAEEFTRAAQEYGVAGPSPVPDVETRDRADRFFREWIERFG